MEIAGLPLGQQYPTTSFRHVLELHRRQSHVLPGLGPWACYLSAPVDFSRGNIEMESSGLLKGDTM